MEGGWRNLEQKNDGRRVRGDRKGTKTRQERGREYISVGMNYSAVSMKQPHDWCCCALASSILIFIFVFNLKYAI